MVSNVSRSHPQGQSTRAERASASSAAVQQARASGVTGYSAELGGYVSASGKFYPTTNPSFVPSDSTTQSTQQAKVVTQQNIRTDTKDVSGVTSQQLRAQESRNQAIANIRAGNVQGVSIKGNIIVNEAGQRVGVSGYSGGQIYNTKTGEVYAPTISETSTAKTPGGTAGLFKDGKVYINKEKFNFGTLAHEAGHYQYNQLLQNLPEETKQKIAKEGQIGLQFKYFDFSKNPMGYSTDSFAVEAMGLAGENLFFGSEAGKRYMATAMPETYKVINAANMSFNKPTNIFISNAEMNKLRGTSEISPRIETIKETRYSLLENKPTEVKGYSFKADVRSRQEVLPTGFKKLAYVSAGLDYLGKKTTEQLSKVPYLAYKENKEVSLPYQTKGTSFYNAEKGFYAPIEYTYQAPSKAEFAGEVIKVAPYFIPYVGEGLIIAGGSETILRTDTSLGQKALGGLVVAGGISGLKTRIGMAEESYATKVPAKQNVDIKITTDISKTSKNIPKIKMLEDTNFKIPQQVKTGIITETKTINPKAITTITSPSDKTFKILEVSDQYGNVIGAMQKGGGRGIFGQVRDLYKTTYKLNPKTQEVTYNIFKNDKFLKTVTQKAESQFGLTERFLVSKDKVSSTKVVPTDIKIRASTQTKVYEQELVSLKNKKIDILGELTSKEQLKRTTILSPAKQNVNLYKRLLTTEPDTNIKMVVTTKTSTGKFSKSSPPDIEIIKAKIARPEEQLIGTLESKTPRFEDVIVQSFKGEGQFTIVNQNALQKYGSKFLSNKKAQLDLFQTKELQLQTQVKVPAFRTSELDTRLRIFIPEMAKVSKESINVGLLGLINIKLLEQQRQKEQLKLNKENISNIKEQLKINTSEQTISKLSQLQIPNIIQQSNQVQEMQNQQLKQQTQIKIQQKQVPKEDLFKITPINKLSPVDITSYLKAHKKRKAVFEALSRRNGKEFSLGTYETQAQAESVLGKYLKSTLAASGRIRAEGKVLPFTSLRSFRSTEFRPAKRDIFKVVQRRGFRLGTGSERLEIKRAKRSKLKVW